MENDGNRCSFCGVKWYPDWGDDLNPDSEPDMESFGIGYPWP
jgi:hypothetical protein